MKSFSKIAAGLLLTASILTTTSITTYAWQNTSNPDGGNWTWGVVQPGNGYEMGYSYYYHGSRSHGSSVTHDGTVVGDSNRVAAGYNAMANGPSVQVNKYKISQWYRFF